MLSFFISSNLGYLIHSLKSNFKISYGLLGLVLLFIIATVLVVACSGKSYTRQETIKNFEKRGKEILVLAAYFRKQKPIDNEVLFEPDGNSYTISIASPNWAINPEHPYNAGRSVKINSAKMDTLLRTLGWTTQTVLTLKDMLIKANCKYIYSDGDYIHLHYGTSDWSSFWYIISEKPFADSIIERDSKDGITFLKKNVRIGYTAAL